MTFVGTVEVKLDTKNRLRIPSVYQKDLSGNLYVSIGFEDSVEIWDAKIYKKLHQEIFDKPSYDIKWRNYKRTFMANTFNLQINDVGRILLPSLIIKHLNNSKNLVIIGVGNHLELWPVEKWNDYNKSLLEKKEEAAEIIGVSNDR